MKKVFFLLLTLFTLSVSSFSQIVEPVKWSSEVEKTGEDTYKLIMNATIDEGWYLYTQDIPEGGPIPTLFTFENENNDFELIGDVEESASKSKFDKIFEMELSYFSHEASFTQQIKVTNPALSAISATVDYQSCDDEKCIFEMADFEFAIPGATTGPSTEKQIEKVTKEEKTKEDVSEINSATDNKGLWAIFFVAFLSLVRRFFSPCRFVVAFLCTLRI